ncbi:MAG: hypothetical protein Q7J78_01730, partial [Clostridiales bacterium]|nr:hypothetical protein [Clostridiales bacterium]
MDAIRGLGDEVEHIRPVPEFVDALASCLRDGSGHFGDQYSFRGPDLPEKYCPYDEETIARYPDLLKYREIPRVKRQVLVVTCVDYHEGFHLPKSLNSGGDGGSNRRLWEPVVGEIIDRVTWNYLRRRDTIERLQAVAGPSILHVTTSRRDTEDGKVWYFEEPATKRELTWGPGSRSEKYSTGGSFPFYMEVDALNPEFSRADIDRDVQGMLAAVRDEWRKGIIETLSDPTLMPNLIRRTQILVDFDAARKMRALDAVKQQRMASENPVENERYLGLIRQAAKILGYEDGKNINIKLQTQEQAMSGLLPSMGSHKSPGAGEKLATVFVGIHQYGEFGYREGAIYPLQEIFRTLCHELAHEKVRVLRTEAQDGDEQPAHSINHTTIEEEY